MSTTNTLLEDFAEFCKKNQDNIPYIFNVLDEQCGHIVENSHTNMLIKLLQYKNEFYGYAFLKSFLLYLGLDIKLEPGQVEFDKERPYIVKDKNGRIDGFIFQKGQFALIIENKVNGAGNQDEQLKRYIDGVLKDKDIFPTEKEENREKIWVIYLTKDGTVKKKPDDESVQYMRELGICSPTVKDVEDVEGPRYAAINYQEHILPWLKEEIQPIVMQKEQILNTGLLQYIDFLEGMLGLRKSDVELLNKGKEMVMNWLKDNSYDLTNFRETNKKLDRIRNIKSNQLNKLAETRRWNIVELRRYAGLLTNIIEEINDEPMADFFDITRNYFESNKLMNECVISHVFNYYYIQIRKASWPRSIHFEWYPLGVKNITDKKIAVFTFCFHVEGSKEIRDNFNNNTQLKKYFDYHQFSSKEHSRQLSYYRVFHSDNGNPFIDDSNDKTILRKFLETIYSEITTELIEIIDQQIESIKK
jgi:hypothetical protein